MVKAFLFLSLSLGLSIAQASVSAVPVSHTENFTLRSNFVPGETVYYNCSSVEPEIEAVLEHMGATNISVRCTGGLDTFNPALSFPAFITMTYESLHPASDDSPTVLADWKQINIRSFDNCAMMTQVYNAVKGTMEMQDVTGPNSCAQSNSDFHLTFTGLIAE
jgi:hypothetical protein